MSEKSNQNADGLNAPIVSATTPNVKATLHQPAKINGLKDGSMPSDGIGGKK